MSSTRLPLSKIFGLTRRVHCDVVLVAGGSSAAVDTLTDVFADHLMNLGRTMRFYLDNEAHNMTPEVRLLSSPNLMFLRSR